MEPTETREGFSGNGAQEFIQSPAPFKHDPPPTRGSGTTPVPRSATSPIAEEGAIFPRSRENNIFSVNTMKLMIHRPVK